MELQEEQILDDFRLKLTSPGCPEQYEVFTKDGKQVGYLRLRHGDFTVEYPDVGGEVIYTAHPKGDGIFAIDEREFYLNVAVEEIRKRLNKEKK